MCSVFFRHFICMIHIQIVDVRFLKSFVKDFHKNQQQLNNISRLYALRTMDSQTYLRCCFKQVLCIRSTHPI